MRNQHRHIAIIALILGAALLVGCMEYDDFDLGLNGTDWNIFPDGNPYFRDDRGGYTYAQMESLWVYVIPDTVHESSDTTLLVEVDWQYSSYGSMIGALYARHNLTNDLSEITAPESLAVSGQRGVDTLRVHLRTPRWTSAEIAPQSYFITLYIMDYTYAFYRKYDVTLPVTVIK